MGACNPKPVRVVHLVTTLNIGGLEMVVLNLTRCCDRSRFQPHVICLGEIGDLESCFREADVPVESLGYVGQGTGRTLFRLTRSLHRIRPHILHTHNTSPHLLGALAGSMVSVPVLVHTKHGRNYVDRGKTVAGNRLASCLSDSIVSVSHDARQVAREVERVPASKIQVIHNGIDLARFPIPNGRPGPNGRRAITVARLNPIKDQHTLLKAARLVADADPGFRLDLVGDGELRDDLVALCNSLGLQDHVCFLGSRDDVRCQLAAADVFVLSSLSEGISLTLLEAMASGLPVVATAVGGNSEVVVDGKTGILVPPCNPERLASAIGAILASPEMARQMGCAGRRRVETEFDLSRVVARYEGLYLSLLKKKRPTALNGYAKPALPAVSPSAFEACLRKA